MTKIVITGSHLSPALALEEQLPSDWQVINLDDPSTPKFRRYDLAGSVPGMVRLPGLILKVKTRLQLIKPDLVVSFGGYRAIPVCLAAKFLHRPLLIHEQTFGAGLTAKITGKLADIIAVSWKSSLKYFAKNKTVLTGNPLRGAILALKRKPSGIIYITGGHQGSQTINRTVESILPQLVKRFVVYHQYGLNQPSQFKHRRYHKKSFYNTQELAKIYSQAELVVGRAGINTVTELAFLKLPAVLIPLPYTQKEEQDKNAAYLRRLGLSLTLVQKDLNPATLLNAINQAKKQLPGQSRVKFPKRRVATAAKAIFDLCLKLVLP